VRCAIQAALEWSLRSQLARRTTGARRRREASRRRSAFLYRRSRPKPARHGARAQLARVLRLLPRDSEHSAPALCETRGAGLALEAAAGTSHHGRAPKGRDCSIVQCPFIGHEPTTTSAAWRARTASSSGAPPPPRQRASARVRCASSGAGMALEAAAGTSHHGCALKGRGFSPAMCPSNGLGTYYRQRGTARERSKLECCASPKR